MLETLLLISLVLVVLMAAVLLVLARKWKAAFADRDWTLAPTLMVADVERALSQARDELSRTSEAAFDARDSSDATREEFSILGRELDARTEEVRALRHGEALSLQRPLLLASVRVLEIIGTDRAAGTDPGQTLLGIQADLEEVLEDYGVETVTPEPGATLPVRGVDPGSARRAATRDPALVGTIASVERPAYVATGRSTDVVLKPAAVTIYTAEEANA